jgi:chaperone modulatory protein CbpM
MVAFGIVEPSSGDSPAEWMFTSVAASRSLRALRLLHDLELNLAGAALVLELMDELQVARARLQLLEGHRGPLIE